MNQNYDTHTIQALLNKICLDKQFEKSNRYKSLLRFLVEQSLANNNMKEHIIGLEMYGMSYNAVKDDGKVRVYMYNLRKKLATYYNSTGKNDKIHIVLNKGSYNLKFVPFQPESSSENSKNKNSKSTLLLSLFSLSIVSAMCFFLFLNYNKQELYCWESFLTESATNTCILADQMVLIREGSSSGTLITNLEINSPNDYIRYSQKNRTDSLQLADFSFFTRSIPYALLDISKLFVTHKANIVPLPESEFQYNKSKNSNLVYIGQFKTMSISKEIFLKNSAIFSINGTNFTSKQNGERITYKPHYLDGVRSEYAMVSYRSLSEGKKALYFVSNHDIGTMALVKNFTDLSFLKTFYSNLPSPQAHFNALFKVEGINRTDTNCKLVKMEVIE